MILNFTRLAIRILLTTMTVARLVRPVFDAGAVGMTLWYSDRAMCLFYVGRRLVKNLWQVDTMNRVDALAIRLSNCGLKKLN